MFALTQAPLVCLVTLSTLEEELEGDWQLCHNFVRRYVSMLPQRLERLHGAVIDNCPTEALDAALSIRSSSLMVGAVRLGELTAALVSLLEASGPRAICADLPDLQLCGSQTICQLRDSYLNLA